MSKSKTQWNDSVQKEGVRNRDRSNKGRNDKEAYIRQTMSTTSPSSPSSSPSKISPSKSSPLPSESKSQSQSLNGAKFKATLYMAFSMAVHFAGHEFARAPTNSMFTSDVLGFKSAAALPLAVGFVSPFSFVLLWVFARMLKKSGPHYALMRSTLGFSAFMLVIGLALHQIQGERAHNHLHIRDSDKSDGEGGGGQGLLSKCLLFLLFIYQSSNVQFLYTQHWSFLGSIMSEEEGKVWFAPIAGIGSIISTIAASQVSHMVKMIGLTGLLCTAALVIGSSAIFADAAYKIARENGFEPKNDGTREKDKNNDGKIENRKGDNIFTTTSALFTRVPILGALFCEVILSQCLSSLLNFQFMVKVKETILDDEIRAGWTGSCYAWINGISGVLQFFLLPVITKRIKPSWIWLFMPLTMLCLTSIQFYQSNSSLQLTAFTFFAMKTIEYSIRGQVSEMVFASLDYESRYLGKEVINLLANRFGKSLMAVTLFLLTTYIEKEKTNILDFLIIAPVSVAALWLLTTIRLTKYLGRKEV